MADHKTSGLDMGKTIEWYASSVIRLPCFSSNEILPFPVENRELIELSDNELSSLFFIFPENSRKRSILRKIIGKPTTWFHKDSTSEQPIPTVNQNEALSDTAIIPSYIDYTPWIELKIPTADVWLYKIPLDIVSQNVRKIILAEGFLHEIGHSIVQPAIYTEEYKIKFSDGQLFTGLEAMLYFAELSEKHPPISHYASTYRGENNKFESKNPKYNAKTAISEEFCEAIAAYFLGFSYCGYNVRSKNPFIDRPEVKDFIEKFLNADRIK